MMMGYTTGVLDLFHEGSLDILRCAKEMCNYLVVGVSTDKLVKSYKNKAPVIPYDERKDIVEAILNFTCESIIRKIKFMKMIVDI